MSKKEELVNAVMERLLRHGEIKEPLIIRTKISAMKGKWGFIYKRGTDQTLQLWDGVEPCESEEQGNARAAQLQAADPTHEYKIQQYLPPPQTARRRVLPDMTVGELIDELKRYDSQLKVVFPGSDGEVEGVKVCYQHAVRKTNDYGDFELVPKWQVEESVELETEQAVVLDKDMKFI